MDNKKDWSYPVTHRVPATFPPYGLYTQDPGSIYKSMRRPEVSPLGLGSAIQMNQFFINRAGKNLSEERKNAIRKSIQHLQTELRYYNAIGKGMNQETETFKQLEEDWNKLKRELELHKEPEPVKPNKYLEKAASIVSKMGAGFKNYYQNVSGAKVKALSEGLARAKAGAQTASNPGALKRAFGARETQLKDKLSGATKARDKSRVLTAAGVSTAVTGATGGALAHNSTDKK